MKRKLPNLLGAIVRDYFTDHLPRVRGTSPHTIHSYRDTVVLLLRFLSVRSKRTVAELDLKDLDPPGILAFLSYLEKERNNGVATRNVRLSAIHALFRFVASRNPEHLDLAQRVLGIPFKRASQRIIDYLEREEIESILKTIDRTTPEGDPQLRSRGHDVQHRSSCAGDRRSACIRPSTDQALSSAIVR